MKHSHFNYRLPAWKGKSLHKEKKTPHTKNFPHNFPQESCSSLKLTITILIYKIKLKQNQARAYHMWLMGWYNGKVLIDFYKALDPRDLKMKYGDWPSLGGVYRIPGKSTAQGEVSRGTVIFNLSDLCDKEWILKTLVRKEAFSFEILESSILPSPPRSWHW